MYMARPASGRVPFAVPINKLLREDLRIIARAYNITMTEVARAALDRFCERYITQAQQKLEGHTRPNQEHKKE